MLARDQRTPFSDWWWTVDKLLLGAIMALMLGGVILSLAASPPVATRIGLDPRSTGPARPDRLGLKAEG